MKLRASLLALALFAPACGPVASPEDGGGDAVVTDEGADALRVDSGGTDAPRADTGGPDAPSPSGYVDPACTDGRYTETLPNVSAAIADVTFSATNLAGYYDTVLMRRYPNGASIVTGGRMNTSFGDCVQLFSGNPTSATAALSSLDTVVHECGHLYDSQLARGMSSTSVYYLTAVTRFSCSRGDTTSRGGDTFARSRITGDAYGASRAPCPASGGTNCDSYAPIYLDGNPDDATFDSGDQGFNMLLEETVQYVNSLATAWSYADQMPRGQRTSARDGILTFLWYTERYLHMARLTYPAAYTRITTDACWRDATLTVWGRAWLYLQATQGMQPLGIDDAALLNLVTNPELLDEIHRLRMAAGCM